MRPELVLHRRARVHLRALHLVAEELLLPDTRRAPRGQRDHVHLLHVDAEELRRDPDDASGRDRKRAVGRHEIGVVGRLRDGVLDLEALEMIGLRARGRGDEQQDGKSR